MRKPPKNLIVECDGKIYIRLDSFMTPMCAFVDGIPISRFGKNKNIYTDVDTAIKWCTEEKRHHSAAKYEKIIANLEKIKALAAEEK